MFPIINTDRSDSFWLMTMRTAATVATNLFVFCVLMTAWSEAQDIWSPRVEINPPHFEPVESTLSTASDYQLLTSQAARGFRLNDDFSELLIGIDETAVLADLNAVIEQDNPSSFATMMGFAVPMQQERAAHAASITVSELAVPSKAHKALQRALEAIRKQRPAQARAEVAAALTIWPHYSDALILSALLALSENRRDAALVVAKEAVQFDETNGMAHIVLAAAHNSKGEYDDAMSALEPALKFRPDAWQAFTERARAEIAKREFSTALADLKRAGELAPPRTPLVHFLKGIALISINKIGDGTSELYACLEVRPTGPIADRARLIIERSQSIH